MRVASQSYLNKLFFFFFFFLFQLDFLSVILYWRTMKIFMWRPFYHRFSQFFISPLVKAEAMEREVLAVDSGGSS